MKSTTIKLEINDRKLIWIIGNESPSEKDLKDAVNHLIDLYLNK